MMKKLNSADAAENVPRDAVHDPDEDYSDIQQFILTKEEKDRLEKEAELERIEKDMANSSKGDQSYLNDQKDLIFSSSGSGKRVMLNPNKESEDLEALLLVLQNGGNQ